MNKTLAIVNGKRSRIPKLLIVTFVCALLLASTMFAAFADTYTGTIDGLPYTYWFLRETTSQGHPCISTTFDYPLRHYSSAASYLGSERVHYDGRNWKENSSTSSAFSSYGSIYAYTSAYYGTKD